MRSMAAGGTKSGGRDGGSSRTEVRCQAPATSVKRSGMGACARRHEPRESAQTRIISRCIVSHDATIGVMAKFRPVRANAKKTPRPQGATGCVILILAIMVGVMVFLYLV